MIPARSTRFNSYPDILRRQHATLPLLSVRFRTHFRESCSVLIVNLVFSEYGHNRSTVHTTARQSRWVVSYRRSASVSDIDQYLICSTVLFGCSCRRTYPACSSQASVSSVRWPVGLGSARTGGDNKAFFSGCIDWLLDWLFLI